MKKLLIVLVVLAFNLSNAQTYEYKIMGTIITYKFTDSLLITTTNKGDIEKQKLKLIEKTERITIYETVEVLSGKRVQYKIVFYKKNKYIIGITMVDAFSGKVNEMILRVKKI